MLLPQSAHAEAMLQYFNTSWKEIAQKMPELAEAGYTSLWLPPPTKGSGGLSVGYDLWDPFDLGSIDQRNSIRTRYGTEAELLHLMEVAHRFGIRVYFDNIMNHRAFDVPGYNENTPIDIYPGMVPEDFHLRKTEDGFYRKWDNTRDWGSSWQVQNLGLADLIDIAHESPNANFGLTEGSTHPKYSFVRQPNNPEYYDRLPDGTWVGFGKNNGITKEIIAANPGYYSEDVNAYLIRAARWLMDRTKADGLRLDAVKHVPDYFFGQQSGVNKNSSNAGYLGGVQWQFNMSRGFSDWDNHRDSVFEDKVPRDDAMVFGEHLGTPPGYSGYWDAGMRLVDNDLRSKLNGVLGSPWGTLAGLDSPGAGGFPASLGITHANSHDSDYSAMRHLQHALYYTREGIGLVYTDGYYKAETLGESGGAFPRHANTAFLGQFGDPRIPNLLQIHEMFARGLQQGLWSDNDFLAYERRDNRRPDGSVRSGSAAEDVTMVVMMNDNNASGQSRPFSHSFPAGAYLYQYATGPNGSSQVGFYKWGSELNATIVPPGGYFIFGWRTPELSKLWPDSAITLYQNGREVERIRVTRKDGPDGDAAFNPYGLPNRGYPAGQTPVPFTYQTTVPVVKGGSPVTIFARADGSAENILLKLDGGVDLNGTVPAGITDPAKRDNPPALRTDIWLGYEQPAFFDRQHPEKFAARIVDRCQIGSPGAETYSKEIGGAFSFNNGPGGANSYNTHGGNVPAWVYHDPVGTVGGPEGTAGVGGSQFIEGADSIQIWAKSNSVGAGFKMFVYYTTDGTYPEGAGGIGRGTTQIAELTFRHNQTPDDWWASASIPKPAPGSIFRYKIGQFKNGPGIQPSWWPADPGSVAYKKDMLTTFRIENFNPATVQYHLHNDYNSLTTGLREGFHVVRAKALLNRNAQTQAALYNTFTQAFYYDAETPQGEVAFPANNGDTVGGSSYEMVIRTDHTVEEVWYHIADSDSNNNDSATLQLNGNGDGFEPFTDTNQNRVRDPGEVFVDTNGNGVYDASVSMAWARATEVTPNPAVTSTQPREWRIRYTNIPASGNATLTFRLLEASSSRNMLLNAADGHFTEITRTVATAGPLERINIAWPQSDGDRVDDNYTMKVYFSKALAAGTTLPQLLGRFSFLANGVTQGKDGWTVDYGSFGPGGNYHELAIPLPNLYNDVAQFLHELKVEYRFPEPDNRVLQAFRLVLANPSTKPYVVITQPAELGSDGRPVEIVLPDGPGPDVAFYTVRVNTSASVGNLTLTGSPAIEILSEPYIDANSNGAYDSGEEFTDSNSNGEWDGVVTTTSGNSKIWDFPWRITAPGTYLLSASTGGSEPVISTRSARVVLRQTVPTDSNEFNDDDNDGLLDYDEATIKPLPVTNAETWTNGDVHVHFAYGKSLPNTPDSDGDGLPDGLEVGWRTAGNATNTTVDTNGDGFPNFIGDLDPPLYAVLENHGFVPGVGSASQGDSRTRQAAGTVTDPTNPDTDGDGIPDGIEDTNRNGWTDGDGKILPTTAGRNAYATARPNTGDWPNNRLDSWETWAETSPTKADSDEDGLLDGFGEDKNFDGRIQGDSNNNRVYEAGEAWTETDPLKADTDGDGLPDGWEVQNGLNPLDNGTDNLATAAPNDGNPVNGPSGDPDADGFANSQELAAGTNPTRVDVIGGGGGEGTINIGTFADWRHTDLLALDEYNEGGSQGADVFRTNNFDPSRDIVAFSFRDGGAIEENGDGKLYFRADFLDLVAYAEQGEVDLYIVIDTGNPSVGERALPDNVDIATDMRWEVVIGAYATNSGSVSVDLNRVSNSTGQYENPYTFGVERRGISPNGLIAVAWSSAHDAVELAVSRQALIDAGWLGDPNSLNFQVFTTRDGTQAGGPGDIAGRNDIRDTIGDDWLASDYWKDQDNIRLNGKLTQYFGRSSANDRGKAAKVMLLAHGNQPVLPASQTQLLVHNGTSGYSDLIAAHEAANVPLSLHITPTLASSLQWARNPAAGAANDGPSLNARIASLVASGRVEILGSTFSDHIPKYFPQAFNNTNKLLAEKFLDTIYGNGTATASRHTFWAPERVLDTQTLALIAGMGYTHTFADQTRHFVKWFGRTSALGSDGFRINEVNGVKIFPIHDFTSGYLEQTRDNGVALPVRELLSRRARGAVQDQIVVLWRDLGDFSTKAKADAYKTNVAWLANRPWVRVVTPAQILAGQVPYKGEDGNLHTEWGTRSRGTGQALVQTAKDWIDHATQENYDNWYFGSAFEQGLYNRTFGTSQIFGKVGETGHSHAAWLSVFGTPFYTGLGDLANATLHGAMFQTAFHNTTNNNLSKFSTGAYIYPDTDSGQTLADFARFSQSQARFAAIYQRVQSWAGNATSSTLGAEAADVDLDGAPEYLLYNSRLFAVFEAKGGRMTAAWMRDPLSGKVWQVAGNHASYSNSEDETEGATNLVGATTTVNAHRTSGFKDWWVVDGSNNGTNSKVNEVFSVLPASTGTGWTFSSGGISKTIRIPYASSERIEGTYALSGLQRAYVRFGLSPNLLGLLLHGHAGLAPEEMVGTTRVNLVNTTGSDTVRAWVQGPQINPAATDVAASGFTTVLRRNQAQTHQVEVELSGPGPHTIVMGFDLGTDLSHPDTDGNRIPDTWEIENFGAIGVNPDADPDNDGVSNFQEFLFGTNPNSASSNRPQTSLAPEAGGYRFVFSTLPGRVYQPQVSTDLQGWSSIGSPLPGDGSERSVLDTEPGPRKFYRVVITPQ